MLQPTMSTLDKHAIVCPCHEDACLIRMGVCIRYQISNGQVTQEILALSCRPHGQVDMSSSIGH
jgi:hypothetical protein